MDRSLKDHWSRVYSTKGPSEVSWFEPVPTRSLALIRATRVSPEAPIIDVGGGASTLVDHLLREGYTDISVLDIAASALEQARNRLSHQADRVSWIEADVLEFKPERRYRVWHDRAVFHFLTDEVRQHRYMQTLRTAVEPGGHIVIATFGPVGPVRCSGLDVQRYSAHSLSELLGSGFELRSHSLDVHRTPQGAEQQFLYGWWAAEV